MGCFAFYVPFPPPLVFGLLLVRLTVKTQLFRKRLEASPFFTFLPAFGGCLYDLQREKRKVSRFGQFGCGTEK